MPSALRHLRQITITWLRRERARHQVLRMQRRMLRRWYCLSGGVAITTILASGAVVGLLLAPRLGPMATSIIASLLTSLMAGLLALRWHELASNAGERRLALQLLGIALSPLLVPLAACTCAGWLPPRP